MDEKKNTRLLALDRRNSIAPEQRSMRSRALCERLVAELLPQLPPKAVVAVYSAMKSEVNLTFFCEIAECQGFRIAYPCMMSDNGTAGDSLSGAIRPLFDSSLSDALPQSLDSSPSDALPQSADAEIRGTTSYSATAAMQFFLLDPYRPTPEFLAHPARHYSSNEISLAGCVHVPYEKLDAVLVPMVAFDDKNNRLGYGGGNYDRLLASMRPQAAIVGVAFEEQRLPRIPLEPHDLPLPCIFVA